MSQHGTCYKTVVPVLSCQDRSFVVLSLLDLGVSLCLQIPDVAEVSTDLVTRPNPLRRHGASEVVKQSVEKQMERLLEPYGVRTLVAKGIATTSKDATRGSWHRY